MQALLYRLNSTVLASLDTVFATDALVWVDDFGVFVVREIHFPENLFRTSVHTLPACLAAMRVKLDVSRLLRLSESFLSSSGM